jgi:hypothetical protein
VYHHVAVIPLLSRVEIIQAAKRLKQAEHVAFDANAQESIAGKKEFPPNTGFIVTIT